MGSVYEGTTAPNPKSSFFMVPNDNLDKTRFIIKGLEVILSFVAFILEEVVSTCISCGPLYFFEFISCTAFLFTLLLLIMLATKLHERVPITCWPTLDLIYSGIIAVLFFIASCAFAADNSHSALEQAAVAFGFLASLAFICDLVLVLREKPWSTLLSREKPSDSNGQARAVQPEEGAPLNQPEATEANPTTQQE